MDRLKELIENAKSDSKKEFIKFTTEVYGVDECVFEHICDIPIFGVFGETAEFITSLSTRRNGELLNIIEEYIKGTMGNDNSCFIYLNEINNILAQEEIEEWEKTLFKGKSIKNYDAFIVYNEPKLREEYESLIQKNSKRDIPKSQEDLEKTFTEYVKGIITYEICLLNANYLIKNKQQLRAYKKDYVEGSKILINILKQMINNYKNGFTIEECLYRVMASGKEKLKGCNINNKKILLLYILFTNELTEWLLFGAYDFEKENKLKKVSMEILGTDLNLTNENLKEKIFKYLSTQEETVLSKKQIEMIEILGLSVTKDTNFGVMPEEKAENKKSDTISFLKVIDENESILKKFFSKILSFFRRSKSRNSYNAK